MLPAPVRDELSGQLVCYARWVIDDEWPHLESGTLGEELNPWGVALFETLRGVEPSSSSEESAYDKWLEQTSTREEARQDRVHGAMRLIPAPLWIALFFISGIIDNEIAAVGLDLTFPCDESSRPL